MINFNPERGTPLTHPLFFFKPLSPLTYTSANLDVHKLVLSRSFKQMERDWERERLRERERWREGESVKDKEKGGGGGSRLRK